MKNRLLFFGILMLVVFLPRGAFAAVSFDNHASANGTGSASLTYGHTVSGVDRALVVGVMTDGTVTGVTYAGTAMTAVNSVSNFPTGNNEYLYYLSNPNTGSNNVVITTSGSATIYGESASYTGVNQTGQPEHNATTTSASTSVSVPVTTTTDNNWLVGVFRNGAGNTTAGSGTNLRGAPGPFSLYDSNGPKSPAGTYSLSVTVSSGQTGGLALSLAPSSVPSSACNSNTSPAICGSSSAGSVAMAAASTTLDVDTTAVTADSQIFVIEDLSLGSRLGLTCNTTPGRVYSISARTAGTSFTIKSSGDIATYDACLSYLIVN